MCSFHGKLYLCVDKVAYAVLGSRHLFEDLGTPALNTLELVDIGAFLELHFLKTLDSGKNLGHQLGPHCLVYKRLICSLSSAHRGCEQCGRLISVLQGSVSCWRVHSKWEEAVN